jgi:signal transduction histidine kinase
LNAVIGYISIARQKDSDADKISHCLENSDIASKHLLAILNDVLDMSSIESGKLKIAKEVFDLEELLCDLNTIYSE